MIHLKAFASEHLVQQRTSLPPFLLRQFAQTLAQFLVAVLASLESVCASGDTDQPAGATLRQFVPGHRRCHHLPLHRGPYPFFANPYFSARRSSAWSATIDLSRRFSSSS